MLWSVLGSNHVLFELLQMLTVEQIQYCSFGGAKPLKAALTPVSVSGASG